MAPVEAEGPNGAAQPLSSRIDVVVAPPQPKLTSSRSASRATGPVYPLVAPGVGAGW